MTTSSTTFHALPPLADSTQSSWPLSGKVLAECRMLNVQFTKVRKSEGEDVYGVSINSFTEYLPKALRVLAAVLSRFRKLHLVTNGSLVLELEGKPVTQILDFMDMFTRETLAMKVARVELNVVVPTVTISNWQCNTMVPQFESPYFPTPLLTTVARIALSCSRCVVMKFVPFLALDVSNYAIPIEVKAVPFLHSNVLSYAILVVVKAVPFLLPAALK